MTKKICVIGGGRWGQNHIRTLYQMGNLAAIVVRNPHKLQQLLEQYPVAGFTSVDQAIEAGFDGYTVVTPAETHYQIGKKLLENGCHTLIEKPMALSSSETAELVDIAERNNVNLMVGHLLLFHPAIRKIKEEVKNGRIGKLYYIYSNRLNLGMVKTKENVFWDLAPHDIAIIDYIIGKSCTNIKASGTKMLQKNIHDTVIAHLDYPDNIQAHIFVSWMHPFKEQRLVVIGSKGMISFEDSSKDKKIIFYNKRIDWEEGIPVNHEEPNEFIDYEYGAPLEKELRYFVEHLNSKVEISDGKSGHKVIEVLERVQEYLLE